MRILVDTNIFIALKDSKDPIHKKALLVKNKIPKKASIVVTSQIISETITILAKKLGKKLAIDFANDLKEFEIIYITEDVVYKALKLFYRIKSKNASFADCTSIVIAKDKKYKIGATFTFDKHFKQQKVKLLS